MTANATPAVTPHDHDLQQQDPLTQQDLLLVQHFHDLSKRATAHFSSLRNFPPYQRRTLWHPYFQKCFGLYSMLWKFQQDHRSVLERAGVLKRWEIGEIASRIAQLYYHFYLRTSETRYLLESNVFYEAIQSRQYYANVQSQESSVPFNKKLRVYARYVVVCLLLNKRDTVRDLLNQLRHDVDVYKDQYPSLPDVKEWQMVVQELSTFLEADTAVQVSEAENDITYRTILSSSKYSTHQPASPTGISQSLVLREAVIVCNRKKSIKFSEMTLDMFRMMQSLEHGSIQSSKSPHTRTKNPHKHILYRPDYRELFQSLSSGLSDLDDNGALLLYISADSCANDGVLLATNTSRKLYSPREQDANCLTLDDITPFMRRPMFLIVDSDNGISFRPKTSNRFGEPFLLIHPASAQQTDNTTLSSSFLTHFLANPVLAFCKMQGTAAISHEMYEDLNREMAKVFKELNSALLSRELDYSYRAFLRNIITEGYILRFLLLRAILKHHHNEDTLQCPQSYPPLPAETLQVSENILAPLIKHQFSKVVNREDRS